MDVCMDMEMDMDMCEQAYVYVCAYGRVCARIKDGYAVRAGVACTRAPAHVRHHCRAQTHRAGIEQAQRLREQTVTRITCCFSPPAARPVSLHGTGAAPAAPATAPVAPAPPAPPAPPALPAPPPAPLAPLQMHVRIFRPHSKHGRSSHTYSAQRTAASASSLPTGGDGGGVAIPGRCLRTPAPSPAGPGAP